MKKGKGGAKEKTRQTLLPRRRKGQREVTEGVREGEGRENCGWWCTVWVTSRHVSSPATSWGLSWRSANTSR